MTRIDAFAQAAVWAAILTASAVTASAADLTITIKDISAAARSAAC